DLVDLTSGEPPHELLVLVEAFRRDEAHTLEDHSTIDTRARIGVENIMVEVDYPHGDSTWPDTQSAIEQAWGHVPVAEVRAMCCENAAALYRHPLPSVVVPFDD